MGGSLVATVHYTNSQTDLESLKPRLVVLTDIGPAEVEPDDNESAVRLLAYADRFEIEAICTTIGWNCDPYPDWWSEYLYRVIDAYEIDVNNLMKRSGQTEFMSLEQESKTQPLGYWPSADYIRSRSLMGSQRAGIGVIGPDNDSPGSDLLIKLADEDDPRPIYVTSWGGANTMAQAIWRVQQSRTPEELKTFLNKFRLYTITDQDMQWSMHMNRPYSSHQWMRREFADDLMIVWDESAWLNQNALGVENWDKYTTYIQGHGVMGEVYPKYKWGVEGDTPSFLNSMPNGLNDPDDPRQVGWDGYHEFVLSPDSITYAWTNYHEPIKTISDGYERYFYPDEFNDFAARMVWAQTGSGNTNPMVIVNGIEGLESVKIKVQQGESVTLDGSMSYDLEGDSLSYKWWQQKGISDTVQITDTDTPMATVNIGKNTTFPVHIVCEVHDNGDFKLVGYRRVILSAE